MKSRVVLAILDGWGLGAKGDYNPISVVNPGYLQYIKSHYPSGALQASGIAVGLPWGEVGNSEVGHLTIGAGKTIYQHFPRISLAIEDGSFFKNAVFEQAFSHALKNNSALNIAGLLTSGSIHASFDHLEALIRAAASAGIKNINLHLFADGKDSPPQSLHQLMMRLDGVLKREQVGVLASLSGRHFALDRDNHWDRTEAAYKAMTGQLAPSSEPIDSVAQSVYNADKNDQEFPPTMFTDASHSISDNDALVFIDFREDSIRQIAESFISPDFNQFPVKKFQNLFIATMTEYTKNFNVPVAFPSEAVVNPIGRVLSKSGKKQLLIAETEKYAHVSYFFNGFRDTPFENQERVLIPSNNVQSHAQMPEMKAREISDKVIEALEKGDTDFIVVNFANADMVAHTGDFNAALEAVRTIDREFGRLAKYCEEHDVYVVVTADHGNIEVMRDPQTGSINTSHDPSPVPIYLIHSKWKRSQTASEASRGEGGPVGILSDVAPTILSIFEIPKPSEMTGQDLTPLLTDEI